MTAPVRDPIVALLILLSGTTGMIDAVSVLGLNKVFTANMTGNIVFLGFAAVGVPGFDWSLFVSAILCFGLGAAVASRSARLWNDGRRRQYLLRSALLEAGLLWLAAAIALTLGNDIGSPTVPLRGVIALTAAAMGARNASVRTLKVPDLTTTVLTLTITGLAADSALGSGANTNWGRRIGSVLAILAGSMLGVILLRNAGLAASLLIAGCVVMGATLLIARNESDIGHVAG